MIRAASPDEIARLVASTWLRSYASSDWARYVTPPDVWAKGRATDDYTPAAEYWDGHRALIARLTARATVRVDENAGDGMVDGWLCAETLGARHVLHYLYVRRSARGNGVARALLADAGVLHNVTLPVVYTHRSRTLHASCLPRAWRFAPYLLMAAEPRIAA